MEDYSLICTEQKPGCLHRHGPPLKPNAHLEFAPCPNCMAKMRSLVGLSIKETRYEKLKRKATYSDGLAMPYKGSK